MAVNFNNKYPYTDFHEINLDWVISQVKYWSEKVGKTIQSIELTGTAGLVDTYTITYSDGTTSTFDVTNGNGIASVDKTATVGLVDTYTITFQNGETSTFEITNGTAGIDASLTLIDYAADARAVGNDCARQIVKYPGYIDRQGSVSSADLSRRYTNLIPCKSGVTITFQAETNHASVSALSVFNIAGTLIASVSNIGDNDTDHTYTTPSNTAFIRFSFASGQVGKIVFSDPVVTDAVVDNKKNVDTLLDAVRKTVYVDGTTGSDSNDGSESAPMKTIMAAINKNVPFVYIAPGTYKERLLIYEKENFHIMAWNYGSYSAANPDTPKIILDGENSRNQCLEIWHGKGIYISDIECVNSNAYGMVFTESREITVENCIAHDCAQNGFRTSKSSVQFIACSAYNIGGTGTGYDGFTMHEYGNIDLIDCVAHDCGDDGVSHHDGCTGFIHGGEFYNCGKGGIASPTHGSRVDIEGAYCHDNVYGIYSLSDASHRAAAGRISNCVMKGNSSYDVYLSKTAITGWNNIYDTKYVDATATFTEFS